MIDVVLHAATQIMSTATSILSIVLAGVLAATGSMKAFATTTAESHAAHLGISTTFSQSIGVTEIGLVIGLLIGLVSRPVALLTAAAIVLLMVGALGVHFKVGDRAAASIPAVVVAALAVALSVTALP